MVRNRKKENSECLHLKWIAALLHSERKLEKLLAVKVRSVFNKEVAQRRWWWKVLNEIISVTALSENYFNLFKTKKVIAFIGIYVYICMNIHTYIFDNIYGFVSVFWLLVCNITPFLSAVKIKISNLPQIIKANTVKDYCDSSAVHSS